jgi:hypothetical protein
MVEARQIPRRFRAERNEGLHRVLRGLPSDFIIALIEGLEGADVITPGRLFAGRSGGCAVGVTMRVVEPDFRGSGLLKRWRRRKSIQCLYRGVAKSIPHLHALEHVFDRSVNLFIAGQPELSKEEAAKAVALWVAGEARAELLLRELNSDWIAAIEPAAVIEAPAPQVSVPAAPTPVFA